jgi:hypothetical protein
LLLPSLAVALGVYLFLLGANYYYAKRADYLLQRIRALRIDNSSIAELRELGSEHGLRYEQANNCASDPCMHMVSPNNAWMRSLMISPTLAEIGDKIGLRSWQAMAGILTENQQMTGKVYVLALFEGRLDPDIQVSAREERKFKLDDCVIVKRHPGYDFRGASNIRSFRVEVSEYTADQNRTQAFQFNMGCLGSWHKCDQVSELMPAAWADFEEDKKWSEAQRSLEGQAGTGCPN